MVTRSQVATLALAVACCALGGTGRRCAVLRCPCCAVLCCPVIMMNPSVSRASPPRRSIPAGAPEPETRSAAELADCHPRHMAASAAPIFLSPPTGHSLATSRRRSTLQPQSPGQEINSPDESETAREITQADPGRALERSTADGVSRWATPFDSSRPCRRMQIDN